MIQPKNETEDLLLSITKICETLIEQSNRKAEETLEFKKTKPRKIFLLNIPVQFKGDWMIELTDLEVYNSIFNINTTNNNFELYNFPEENIRGVSYGTVRDDIEKDLDFSDLKASDLQNGIIAPIINKEYRD